MHLNASWWKFYYFLTQSIPSSCVMYTGTKVVHESLLINMIVVNNQENVHRLKTDYTKLPTKMTDMVILCTLQLNSCLQ